MEEIKPVRVLLRRVAARLRAQRAVEAVSSMLMLSGAWALIAIFLLKIGHLENEHLPQVLAVALFFPLAALAAAFLRPVHHAMVAQIVDRRLGLKDLIGSAHDFSSREQNELSPFAEYTLQRAAERAVEVQPKEALPLRFPRSLGIFALQLLAVLALTLLPQFPEPAPARAAPPPPDVQGMAVDFDELDGLNQVLQDVHQEALDEEIDEVAEAAEEFNKLLQDLADQRLPYREALDRIAALEQKLAREPWEPDPEAERFLKQVGRDLAKAKVTEKTGEALETQKLREARDEARKAADQVKREPPDRRQLEQLKRALKKAAERQPPDFEQRLEQLEQERRRLKQKQQKRASQNNKRRLKRNKRELERLRRNLDRQRQKQRQLERLSRNLQQMSESLNLQGQDQQQLEQMLQQLGEDINRMAREQTTDEQMRQMRQRLEELRRLLQQLRRGGKGFKMRLAKFNKGAKCGCKSGGSGKGGQGGKTVSLTPGGRGGKGLMPLKIKGAGGSKGQGQESPGGGKGQGVGDSHDPNTLGEETKIKAQHTDIQVSPQQGEGPVKSEVIETAADQGFASPSYGEVHETYERHAESLMEKQEIPPGYRRYIRHYFERIRPR